MERILPLRITNPRFAMASSADIYRAKAILHPSHAFECRLPTNATFSTTVCLTGTTVEDTASWPSFQHLQSALAIALVFDLQDYSNGATGSLCEMQARLDSSLGDLARLGNRGPPSDMPFLLLLSNSEAFQKQLEKTNFVLGTQRPTNDYDAAISDIEMRFRTALNLPFTSLILKLEEGVRPKDLLETFEHIAEQRNGR